MSDIDIGADIFAVSISSNIECNLKIIKFSKNKITYVGMKYLGKLQGNQSKLEHLNLHNNLISE